ncbi:uncharacterized protein LOC127529731 [Erpetoichthys calabaricus]|uniref:uncharacterized protein LOC127529731 n=1 Tax=Erpetoichthys calabaricus TaxID=27687 RepID=UPI002234CF48|nr:uncharacterized protein LOC127529731 [Erpetoichthys calabaricus]
MIHFEKVLSIVKKTICNASSLEIQNFLRELLLAKILTVDCYQCLLTQNDTEDLARRVSLNIWEKWDFCHGIISSLLNIPETLLLNQCSRSCGDQTSNMEFTYPIENICQSLDFFGMQDISDGCILDYDEYHIWTGEDENSISLDEPNELEKLCEDITDFPDIASLTSDIFNNENIFSPNPCTLEEEQNLGKHKTASASYYTGVFSIRHTCLMSSN